MVAAAASGSSGEPWQDLYWVKRAMKKEKKHHHSSRGAAAALARFALACSPLARPSALAMSHALALRLHFST